MKVFKKIINEYYAKKTSDLFEVLGKQIKNLSK